ncbi:hypothetical protein M0D21_19995 [Aquimarina sp. D1M17]|uniref:hypothetical protein n=1 Tax=Aquimarina acroporae TaxID=2937283 RepID=UPI0020BEAABB|nr:hypothetical protein [Aquimarina acroporae]MCK8523869.1 hypothetical protein [Aquimarina acroporae]
MSFSNTQHRWDSFLKKIEERFQEILQKTEAALPMLFEATDFETTTFSNAWQGIYSQATDLIYKIDDTWQEKVEDAFLDIGVDFGSETFNKERDKGHTLRFNLEQQLKKYEVKIFADAANKLLIEVKDILTKDFCCTQCQAKLPVKDNFFRSYYSTCSYCQTVNTFEPGTKARNIEHFAIHALGEEAGLTHYLRYEEFKFQNHLRDSEIYSKVALASQYQKYVEAYLKKRIEIIPEYEDRYEKDLKAKTAFLTNYQ